MNKEKIDIFLDSVKEFINDKAEELDLNVACMSIVWAITITDSEVAAVHASTKSVHEFWEEWEVGENLAMYDAAQQMFKWYKAIASQLVVGIIGKMADKFSSEERDEILKVLNSLKPGSESQWISEHFNELDNDPREAIFGMLKALKNA